jgi:ketosteroid isomerase-like protein
VSQENVEVVRRVFEAWNAGDIDALVASHAVGVEVQTDPRFREVGTLAGRDEARRWYEGVREAWEEGGVAVPGEFRSVADRVLVRCRWGGRGKASGIDTYIDVYCVASVRFGAVRRVEYYFDRAEALESVEVRE